MCIAAVKLVKSVRVLLPCSSVVSVEVDGIEGDVLLEPPEEWSDRIEEYFPCSSGKRCATAACG